ncbi:hypothetical protein DL766_005186 [Monosporascus sp. MC13-8B]|uniref:Ras-GEF domain-containing protein n=1 Tax=Monosporascus cannonballus TaxID=155416 RepID=A0ABY0HA89_9PEZI|nr:hypothetical protein DL762_003580 [Monosporascus cannonballus]RYO98185.1 hypothetical protein DL763_002426 [Monosporascus cannonballus]RYP29821.1 hypothetical protein DL766_005186 [Monosporascus sp. MC13-8B]
MEVDPLASHPPPQPRPNPASRQLPRRDLSTRTAKSPYVGVREPKFRRSPPRPLGHETDKSAKGGGTSPVASSKNLVPVVERKSGDVATGGRKDGDSEKSSITPDGGSAGREGRKFTVANVGNNGRIFLRPSVRPANQRYPQPNFVFPITPPSTEGLHSLTNSRENTDDASEFLTTQPTPLADSPSPWLAVRKAYFEAKQTSRPRRRRAMSDSTVHEGDTGAFKVVISKPRDDTKAKTAEDLNAEGIPLLQIPIPSWKIGTPRFSLRGTPFIRGSSYAPTEDIRSSTASFFRASPLEMNSLHPESVTSRTRPSSLAVPQLQFAAPSLLSPDSVIVPRLPVPPAKTTAYRSTAVSIEPAMFDSLTFSPGCDDRSVVRYSSLTGAVTAATPPRLVAEITSPNFLDYELISDFFLTFRSFLETSDLLRMLIARLQWALEREDEVGMVVRVRTFVAVRHWILNYFVEDFVVDYHLRLTFCNIVNDLVEEVSQVQDQQCRKVQLKILGELKKCWRRVCALYWDGPEFGVTLGPEIPIAPGGIAGYRDPSLDPGFWETDSEEPPYPLNANPPQRDSRPDHTLYADVSKAGHIDSILLGGERPATPEERPAEGLERSRTSPTSTVSLDVLSCSFPTKALRIGDSHNDYPVGAHPVDPGSLYANTEPVAFAPRALAGKGMRPQASHRRNNSLTDSLREHGTTAERALYKNSELFLTVPYAGSLVRGNLLPPGQPFVDMVPPYCGSPSRETTIFQPLRADAGKEKEPASAMSSQGMRKLIYSVRRAVSTRAQGVSPPHGGFTNNAPICPRSATTNRLPGTAIVPQARSRANNVRHPVRIDLLGALSSEEFKKAVREDATAEAEANNSSVKIGDENLDYSAAHLDSSFELSPDPGVRPTSDTAITTGSKSIVIVDGTYPINHRAMTGALPVSQPPAEGLVDSFVPTGAADPTPPNTPPGPVGNGGTPRRSSLILGQQTNRTMMATDPLPPFVPDLATLGASGGRSEDTSIGARSPIDVVHQSPVTPLPSHARQHRRQQSSRSYRSRGSLMHRRWASFQSGYAAESTVKSFDATTYSGSVRSEASMPPPLRVLRRMPGGDLKGVKNVADLDTSQLHRSRSAGSLTTYSESIRSSYIRSPVRDTGGFVDVVNSDFSQNRAGIFSLGAVAEQAPKRQLSLFSTHSSKPVVRASFEAEAQKLAQIPDDADDDGGVESALLKLEGKYEKKVPKLSMDLRGVSHREPQETGISPMSAVGSQQSRDKKDRQRNLHVGEDDDPVVSPVSDTHTTSRLTLQVPRSSTMHSFFSEASGGSYDSTPLLERGLMTDDGHSKTNMREWTNRSILQGPDTPEELDDAVAMSGHPSYEIVQKTGSMDNIKPGQSVPRSDEIHSFLDVESGDDSDLSSELSGEMIELDEIAPGLAPSPRKPLNRDDATAHANSVQPSECPGTEQSPAITFREALQISPPEVDTPDVHEHQIWSRKPFPPTPSGTPTVKMYHNALGESVKPPNKNEPLRNAPALEEDPKQKFSVHLPFVLAFDSEVLAQQFTLIEKDALNEVDWKELIDMRWKNANTDPRSWVDFLRNTDAHGVEVVIARFNVMVKWVVSEIVLTQDPEERARCVIKFLHIAAHCRRYRNFATTSQIAIALTSNEIARLTKTWAMVPPADLKTMSELESLVSPTKNFHNLRAEMEGGSGSADNGCIPFVCIYTHDLLFNSQRPSEIASSPTTPPLVNFERCRIAASVVKTLLRLLEASTLYQFQPIEGITERCLWMTALSDDDIRKHSESLE